MCSSYEKFTNAVIYLKINSNKCLSNKTYNLRLATGGFDGDIVIWNSVTELANRHLSARKKIIKTKEVVKIYF